MHTQNMHTQQNTQCAFGRTSMAQWICARDRFLATRSLSSHIAADKTARRVRVHCVCSLCVRMGEGGERGTVSLRGAKVR
jgi:hypothetical protein